MLICAVLVWFLGFSFTNISATCYGKASIGRNGVFLDGKHIYCIYKIDLIEDFVNILYFSEQGLIVLNGYFINIGLNKATLGFAIQLYLYFEMVKPIKPKIFVYEDSPQGEFLFKERRERNGFLRTIFYL